MVAKQKASPAPAYCLLTTKTKTTLTNKNNQKMIKIFSTPN